MACSTILQTFILATVLLNLNTAMPTTSAPPTPTCGECAVHCSGEKCTGECNNKGLSQVPNECHTVAILRISYNSVHQITTTTFQSFDQLEVLKMKNNGIDAIEEGSFAETMLSTIDLSNNRLPSLGKAIFLNLTNLTHVKVSNNLIDSIGEYNLPNLTYLDMSYNRISEIQRSSFSMMTHIRHLYLASNSISYLGNNFLGELIHLTTLDLSGNNIETIDRQAFYFLTNLEILDLSDNEIKDEGFPTTPGALFKNQIHLKILSISNNEISSLQIYMLKGLQKNLTKFSADNNQISTIEAGMFEVLKFQNFTKLNLTNNHLDSNFSKDIVPLLENGPTPKIELKGNPLCEEYQTVFKGQYNKSIFCSTKQMIKHLTREQNIPTTDPNATGAYDPQVQPNQEHETLKLVCIVGVGVLVVLLIILVVVWIKSQNRRTGNYTTCVPNRSYQYPSVSQPETTTPPTIPPREPLLRENEEYANTSTVGSYITPNNQSSTNGHLPSTNRHPPSTNNHPPPINRHPTSTNRHPTSTNRHPTSTNRHQPSSSKQSFRRSFLKRLPSIPYKNSSDQPIVVIGTTGTTTGTTRIEGLPQCKSVIKKHMSHNHKKAPKPTAQSGEEGVYMIRDETEDGKPKDATMASYRSVQD